MPGPAKCPGRPQKKAAAWGRDCNSNRTTIPTSDILRMNESPIRVHSVAEAFLCVMVRPCRVCGKGPLSAVGDIKRVGESVCSWQLDAQCKACRAPESLQFNIDPVPSRQGAESSVINSTPHRSEAIDLLGWLTLYRTIVATVKSAANPAEARKLASEAAQCLDEALKFYTMENELPPEDAFFSDESRRRFADHPDQFARTRWREERLKLPAGGAIPASTPTQKRRSWWPWRRSS